MSFISESRKFYFGYGTTIMIFFVRFNLGMFDEKYEILDFRSLQ